MASEMSKITVVGVEGGGSSTSTVLIRVHLCDSRDIPKDEGSVLTTESNGNKAEGELHIVSWDIVQKVRVQKGTNPSCLPNGLADVETRLRKIFEGYDYACRDIFIRCNST